MSACNEFNSGCFDLRAKTKSVWTARSVDDADRPSGIMDPDHIVIDRELFEHSDYGFKQSHVEAEEDAENIRLQLLNMSNEMAVKLNNMHHVNNKSTNVTKVIDESWGKFWGDGNDHATPPTIYNDVCLFNIHMMITHHTLLRPRRIVVSNLPIDNSFIVFSEHMRLNERSSVLSQPLYNEGIRPYPTPIIACENNNIDDDVSYTTGKHCQTVIIQPGGIEDSQYWKQSTSERQRRQHALVNQSNIVSSGQYLPGINPNKSLIGTTGVKYLAVDWVIDDESSTWSSDNLYSHDDGSLDLSVFPTPVKTTLCSRLLVWALYTKDILSDIELVRFNPTYAVCSGMSLSSPNRWPTIEYIENKYIKDANDGVYNLLVEIHDDIPKWHPFKIKNNPTNKLPSFRDISSLDRDIESSTSSLIVDQKRKDNLFIASNTISIGCYDWHYIVFDWVLSTLTLDIDKHKKALRVSDHVARWMRSSNMIPFACLGPFIDVIYIKSKQTPLFDVLDDRDTILHAPKWLENKDTTDVGGRQPSLFRWSIAAFSAEILAYRRGGFVGGWYPVPSAGTQEQYVSRDDLTTTNILFTLGISDESTIDNKTNIQTLHHNHLLRGTRRSFWLRTGLNEYGPETMTMSQVTWNTIPWAGLIVVLCSTTPYEYVYMTDQEAPLLLDTMDNRWSLPADDTWLETIILLDTVAKNISVYSINEDIANFSLELLARDNHWSNLINQKNAEIKDFIHNVSNGLDSLELLFDAADAHVQNSEDFLDEAQLIIDDMKKKAKWSQDSDPHNGVCPHKSSSSSYFSVTSFISGDIFKIIPCLTCEIGKLYHRSVGLFVGLLILYVFLLIIPANGVSNDKMNGLQKTVSNLIYMCKQCRVTIPYIFVVYIGYEFVVFTLWPCFCGP